MNPDVIRDAFRISSLQWHRTDGHGGYYAYENEYSGNETHFQFESVAGHAVMTYITVDEDNHVVSASDGVTIVDHMDANVLAQAILDAMPARTHGDE